MTNPDPFVIVPQCLLDHLTDEEIAEHERRLGVKIHGTLPMEEEL